MSHHRLPPPPPEECLIHARSSRYKGGTIVAEDVWTVAEHRRRVADGSYRPGQCRRCAWPVLHVHDYVERHPVGIAMLAVLKVVRFICANPECEATWRVLPALLARHLWWVWRRIEGAVGPAEQAAEPVAEPAAETRPVPESTRRRWAGRLCSSARQLVELLVSRGTALLRAVGEAVGLDETRYALVAAHTSTLGLERGQRLAALGGQVDRLERGVRLM